mgnify:CR=1 FL=1
MKGITSWLLTHSYQRLPLPVQIAAIFYALMLCTYTFACSCSLLTTIIIQPVLKLMTRPQPVAILPSSEHHLRYCIHLSLPRFRSNKSSKNVSTTFCNDLLYDSRRGKRVVYTNGKRTSSKFLPGEAKFVKLLIFCIKRFDSFIFYSTKNTHSTHIVSPAHHFLDFR